MPANTPTPTPPSAGPNWRFVWSDEFDGPDGSAVDGSKWSFDIGGEGWGNGELQYYTDRSDNAYLSGGALVIRAAQEQYRSNPYTSARLVTRGKFEQAYGRFEARIRVPVGQGIWPAFWMLGGNIGTVGWPASGEIDVMEVLGKAPERVHASAHGPGYSGSTPITGAYVLPGGAKFSDEFHVFAVEWESDELRFYADDNLYHTVTPANLPAGKPWVFDHPFHILLNVAVGGAWPGFPDATTVFPQQMYVDYVRVYQRR